MRNKKQLRPADIPGKEKQMKRDKEYYVRKLTALEVRDFSGKTISKPEDIYEVVKHYGSLDVEYFLTITIDGSNRIIKIHEITKGILNKSLVHPREVFRAAILDRAAAIIIAHNHPSNNLEPSSNDRSVTKTLQKAGEIIGIPVLDSMVIGQSWYTSFKENNDI